MIPSEMPLAADVDYKTLAQVPLSGGHIKNCVLMAARMAALKGLATVSLPCFTHALRRELASAEGWAQASQPSCAIRPPQRPYDKVAG